MSNISTQASGTVIDSADVKTYPVHSEIGSELKWEAPNERYRLIVEISKEEDGQFSVVVPVLPGAASCGDTAEEAEKNIKNAVRALIASYRDHDKPIPWEHEKGDVTAKGAERRTILVDA